MSSLGTEEEIVKCLIKLQYILIYMCILSEIVPRIITVFRYRVQIQYLPIRSLNLLVKSANPCNEAIPPTGSIKGADELSVSMLQ